MNHHETAAADISGARIGHGQRKTGRDRRVDRVTALSQDIGAELRGDLFLGNHHAVFGGNRAHRGEVSRRIEPPLFLRAGWRGACNDQDDGGQGAAPSTLEGNHQKSAAVRAGVTPGNRSSLIAECYMGLDSTGKTPLRDL
jgi:hypothetical protein